MEISVVIPLYRCYGTIEELTLRLCSVFESMELEYEIILVNDASPDGDWELVTDLVKKHESVLGINLSRNFGQHPAIFCGLEQVKGNWVVVMDGDLQDVPEEIIKLYAEAQKGNDIVFAKRVQRKDSLIKKLSSKYFYKVLNYLTEAKFNHEIGNFGIYHKKVIHSVLSMGDEIKFFYPMIDWVGYQSTSIEVFHEERTEGTSSYSYYKLFKLAFNGMISFSNKPLKLLVKTGFLLVFISILFLVITFFRYLNGEITVPGYSSIIFSLWFLSGFIVVVLGLIGIYLGKVFDKVKDRPSYIIKEMIK